ncbi:unnamed protein product [Leptosia nina]|uniref:Uncharacterized protein n=1 Tax=Leptosia nina TaxID=320188 RepID=A0AAV1JKD2_9NEOP
MKINAIIFEYESHPTTSRVTFTFPFVIESVTKFIRIGIADKNDNPPYFDKELYEAEVDENEDIQHTVLTVTAKDHDECIMNHIARSSMIDEFPKLRS